MVGKLLSPIYAPQGPTQHIPETSKGDPSQRGTPSPQVGSGSLSPGLGQAGCPWAWPGRGAMSGPGGRQVEWGKKGGRVCGNAVSGNQQDLLGYMLNPPHKRGLFVGTGCQWLSHTCLASRAWRIKDNWFSPDRKYQEC